MSSGYPESRMRTPVCEMRLFRDRGVRFTAEIPYGTKRIDLAGVSSDSRVYAIELKVKNWRDAVWQASVYQLCADFAFIAIREEFCHRVDKSYLGRLGIGLISVGDDVAWLDLDADLSPVLDAGDRDGIRAALATALATNGDL